MSRYFDGSGDHLTVASAVVSATPLTMAVWCRRTVTGSTHALMSACSPTSGDNQFRLRVSSSNALVADTVVSGATGSSGIAIPDTTSWHHCLGVWRSSTDRQAYVNGTGDTVGTTSKTMGSISSLRIGAASEGWYVLTGYLAHPACWNVALTDGEIAALAAGASPLSIRPGALVAYWPFLGRDSPEIDVVGRYDLTVTNAAANAEEPRAPWSSRGRIFLPASAGGGGAISGSAALTFGAGSSALTGTGALAGTSALVFDDGSSVLTATGALAGSSALVFAGSATAGAPGVLAGSAALVFANSATLVGGGALAGSAAMVTGAGSSTLTGAGALAGASALVFGAGSTVLTGTGALAGVSAVVFSASLQAEGSIAGSVALVFGAGASTLTALGALAGNAALTLDGAGTLSRIVDTVLTGPTRITHGEGWTRFEAGERVTLIAFNQSARRVH